MEPEKKKRGRRKKVDDTISENIQIILEDTDNIQDLSTEIANEINEHKNTLKKRGRKPKGGKLTTKQPDIPSQPLPIANIILHLKCSLSDLTDYNNRMNKLLTNPMKYNPEIPPDIMTYNDANKDQFCLYDEREPITDESGLDAGNNESNMSTHNNETANFMAYKQPAFTNNTPAANQIHSLCYNCAANFEDETADDSLATMKKTTKDINAKLKKLKINLYKNNLPDKKSACFWCTYEYDNAACYIPKYEMDDRIFGYGSFCRPECAVAYLMKENIDDSTKFERYHLLNQIYSKVYDFKKSIKPAPNPYYLLDKFYGNLTIQEYRKLLKTEHMLLVIDKPLTRILPELHEDNEDMAISMYGGPGNLKSNTTMNNSGIYKVKRQSEKLQGPSKSSIIRDKFGMV